MFEKYKENANDHIRELLLVTHKERSNSLLVRMVIDIANSLNMKLEICSDQTRAVEIANSGTVNTILVDFEGPDTPGHHLAKSIRACDVETPMLLFSNDMKKVQHFNIAGCFNLDINVDKASLKDKISKAVKFDIKLREMYLEIADAPEEYEHFPEELKRAKIQRMKVDKFEKKFEELLKEGSNG